MLHGFQLLNLCRGKAGMGWPGGRATQRGVRSVDGVGKEVVAAGRAVLDALAADSGGAFAFAWEEFP